MAKRSAVESGGPALQDLEVQPVHRRRAAPQTTTLSAARGDLAADAALRRRIRGEFEEMPGLSLTRIQAMRLFGVSADVVARIFCELAAEGVLRLTGDGQYVLDHEQP